MWKINPIAAAIGLSAMLLVSGPIVAQETASDTSAAATPLPDPVALVNGSPISKLMYESYAQQRQAQLGNADSPEIRRALTDELVVQELLMQEAIKQKLEESAEVASQMALVRRNVLATAVVRNMLASQSPDEDVIKKEYDNMIATMAGTEYKARHILVDSEDKAKSLIDEIKGGADFAELAKAHSSDGSGAQGGDLGWFSKDMMVPAFAEAVAKLEKGSYTEEPVQTQFGWHVIMLDDTREATPPSLEELRPQISQRLQGQIINDYLTQLRQGAEIDIKLQ